ncbi:uncharacterized protein SCHCODRAFT_01194127 [Schizophyllum commune H4-8]|uniref:Uncharacterized protein n=1 Tax=Schizophyllum commune (strain H4-8 / FGSC 9210) TaxID=578458 RepID=D8QKY6_SCHCM|nr:uncharacterized protein SCHCODRAFT_01194127 [Schizophyllum commune H4-8]KAI5885381.1 hypothetical protein SCHCODRAFT_01194127 [Schizophyllum commune H4-8]
MKLGATPQPRLATLGLTAQAPCHRRPTISWPIRKIFPSTPTIRRAAPGLDETLTNVAASGPHSPAARERLDTLDGVTHARNRRSGVSSSSAGPSAHFVASQGVREAQVQSPTFTHASLLSAPVIPPPSAPAAMYPSSSQATDSADLASRVHPLLSNMDVHSERVIELLQDMRDSLRRMADRPPPSAHDEDVQGSAGVTVQQLELSPGDNASLEPSAPQGLSNDVQPQPVATTDSTFAGRGDPTGPASPIAAASAINNNFIDGDVPVWSPVHRSRTHTPSELNVRVDIPEFDESSSLPGRLLVGSQTVDGTAPSQEDSAMHVDAGRVNAPAAPTPADASAQAEEKSLVASPEAPAQTSCRASEDGPRDDVQALRSLAPSDPAAGALPGASSEHLEELHVPHPLTATVDGESFQSPPFNAGQSAGDEGPSASVGEEPTPSLEGSPSSLGEDPANHDGARVQSGDSAQLVPPDLSIPTFVGRGRASKFCSNRSTFVVDVGMKGDVGDYDRNYLVGDFANVVPRLPELFEPVREVMTQLYLRIGKLTDEGGKDTMARIMYHLRPFLPRFFAVHIDMDGEQDAGDLSDTGILHGYLLNLSSLHIEGSAAIYRSYCFPLSQLRQLNIKVALTAFELLDIIDQSKNLDLLVVNFQNDLHRDDSDEKDDADQGGEAEGSLTDMLNPRNVRFPPALHIIVDDPTVLIPQINAAQRTTRYFRLTLKGPCPSVVKEIFNLHEHWRINYDI